MMGGSQGNAEFIVKKAGKYRQMRDGQKITVNERYSPVEIQIILKT
jgi:hypothetical protein